MSLQAHESTSSRLVRLLQHRKTGFTFTVSWLYDKIPGLTEPSGWLTRAVRLGYLKKSWIGDGAVLIAQYEIADDAIKVPFRTVASKGRAPRVFVRPAGPWIHVERAAPVTFGPLSHTDVWGELEAPPPGQFKLSLGDAVNYALILTAFALLGAGAWFFFGHVR